MIAPTADAHAREDPEIVENNMFVTQLVWASAPGIGPTRAFANSMSRDAIPPWFMIAPANTNRGIASSANESTPL